MIDGATATFTVTFGQSGRPRSSPTAATCRVPRVARFLALAHEIDRRVRVGELDDLTHAGREFGLTRARITQITNLLLLAPAIQEEIFLMPPVTIGRDLVTHQRPDAENSQRRQYHEPFESRRTSVLCIERDRDEGSKEYSPWKQGAWWLHRWQVHQTSAALEYCK